jgi:MoxR-like ATPase
VYEWDYGRQMLEIRLLEVSGASDRAAMRQAIFSDAFLLKRPLLQAIEPRERPAVLLIDEIDRADEEFEGYLFEVLSEYQITVPELGTIRAATPPRVVLTSNRTREIHDALKRRCVYQWIDYPSYERELAIVTATHPRAPERLSAQVTALVQELRSADLYKAPGISETLDWVAALVALDRREVDPDALEDTLGVVLKAREDVQAMRGDRLRTTLNRALARGVRQSG